MFIAALIGLYILGTPLGAFVGMQHREHELTLARARLARRRSDRTYSVGIFVIAVLWPIAGLWAWWGIAGGLASSRKAAR